jgi:murein DD-endopeptidase MepM/ murein hydrolase activator NlpD
MTASRREFLIVVAGAPLALVSSCGVSRGWQSPAAKSKPVPTPAQPDYVLLEGKTLIAQVSFPSLVTDLTGSLPVRIEPESLGGEQLNEPQPLFFYPGRDERTFRIFLTAPLDVVEGNYAAILIGKHDGAEVRQDLKCSIHRGDYHETSLTVDKSFSQPTPEMVKRMRSDFETMLEIYKRRTPRSWNAPFVEPLAGPDKDNFGDKRTYNKTKHSRHAGLDYRAALGTPVKAINDGVIALSGEQWVAGQTVCIDHGGGVFSKYLHLSQRKVGEKDVVKRGDVIGLSGHSGSQKPPPHLHLDLTVNGVKVDPKDFMRTASQLLALEAADRPK